MSDNSTQSAQWRWQTILTGLPTSVDSLGPEQQLSARSAGRGPPVVLLHGIGSSSGSWCYQFDSLAGEFTLHAWDMPGYARSSRASQATCEQYAQIVDDWMSSKGIDNAVVVGHSLGALIAARLAVQAPSRVRGLFLSDAAAGHSHLAVDEAQSKFDKRMQRFKELGPIAHAADRAAAMLSPQTTPEALSLVQFSLEQLQQPGYGDAARVLQHGDIKRDLAQLRTQAPCVPVMMLCGDDDSVTPPAGVMQLTRVFDPACPYVGLPQAGHASQIDAPVPFNQALKDFVHRCDAGE